MQKKSLILSIILIAWSIYHAMFLPLNDVLKVADSFAYLQMSHFLQSFSQEWLWNGWFGFVYSLPIALIDTFTQNDFLAAKIVNIILFNISSLLLWKISRKILSESYSYIVIFLFFLSPTLLHFNIHVLSENIYIPLFLWIFLASWNFIEHTIQNKKWLYKDVIFIAGLMGLMYLTRAEAFIYIGAIGIISITLLIQKKLSISHFLKYAAVFFVSFFVFISPYLFHLHSLTGEWWLTNKWASNLRQAELRGQDKMDDAGFEQAVAELTKDNHHLIAGFAGGMPYNTPRIEDSLIDFISASPSDFAHRVWKNQLKLYTQNFPEIILWKSPQLFFSEDIRFKNNYLFLLFTIIPLWIIALWLTELYKKNRRFLFIAISFFIPASVFFTLFFTLNRYFLIFLPLLLITFTYGISQISWYKKYSRSILIVNYVLVLLLSTSVYYNIESSKDEHYALKKEAGEWLHTYSPDSTSLKIMERFPIVTYYSESKTRYITPYTDNIEDIVEYGRYNNIDFLVVDSMDFSTYRPALKEYLENTPNGFQLLQEFQNSKGQKVILYLLEK